MTTSIEAYDNRERVARYDADMDLMHPNRHKMVDIALEILPFDANDDIRAIDVGIGTGYFAERLLRRYPRATLVGVDGSAAMIDLARSRLAELAHGGRVSFVRSAFQELDQRLVDAAGFDLVFSSYSLHHLDADEKRAVISGLTDRMTPAAWFLNADLVADQSAIIERAIQEARVAGIHERNAGKDERFSTPDKIRAFLDSLESTEGDQPLTLDEDLTILRECGIPNATVFWKEYREVVYGGSRND